MKLIENVMFASITPEMLHDLTVQDLRVLRRDFSEAWDKGIESGSFPDGLNQEEFLNRAIFLEDEFLRRGISFNKFDDLLSVVLGKSSKPASEIPVPDDSQDQPGGDGSTDDSMSEAFHIRDTHWVPVPESGTCPSTHPTKLKFPGTDTDRCFRTSAAATVRRMSEQERPSLKTQTYILAKERFKTQGDADKWMDDNDVPRPKVDEKENSFRYRQFPPEQCQEGSERTFRITDGVQIVGCRLKPEFRETGKSLSEQAEKLTNERSNLREANPDNPTERCKFCTYFEEPTGCKIVEGPVGADLVCDWIFSRGTEASLYEISDENWLAFVKGMIEKQPYQHIVRDGAITPEGPVVLIEDTAEPPHRFSLTKAFHVGHTSLEHHWTQAEVDNLVKEGTDDEEAEPMTEGIRPAFGSSGGKRNLAQKIVSLIPDHKKYVEAFIGGGAVFFAKRPSEKEVINDKNVDIAHAFRFIKSINGNGDRIISDLKKRPVNFSRNIFFKLRDHKESSDIGRFHRFLYLNAFSFGKSMTSTVKDENASGFGPLTNRIDRLPRVSDRIKETSISNDDFRTVIGRHDGPDTFFYLDPPYPEQQAHLKTDLTNQDIFEAVKKIKGKFMLSLPSTKETRSLFKEFHIKPVSVRRTMEMKAEHQDSELLIANFQMRPSKSWLVEADFPEGLSESFRIDLKYVPDKEPTHDELEAKRKEIEKKFEDFVKKEFPKGDIKVKLENLIPKDEE